MLIYLFLRSSIIIVHSPEKNYNNDVQLIIINFDFAAALQLGVDMGGWGCVLQNRSLFSKI